MFAAAIVRLEWLIARREKDPKTIRNRVSYLIGMLPDMCSPDFPPGELKSLLADVEHLLKPEAEETLSEPDLDFVDQADKYIERHREKSWPLETIQSAAFETIAKGDLRKQRIFKRRIARLREAGTQ
jgi:hypothetical protein